MRQINPIDNNGSIQLKFSVSGKRYSFNPIPGGTFGEPLDMSAARAIATRISHDILSGHFDTTLNSYRLAPKVAPVATVATANLLALWDVWVSSLDISEATKADKHRWARVMIAKANPGLTDVTWLTSSKLAPATYRDRLCLLKACYRWAVSQGYIDRSPYETLKPRKATRKPPKPFAASEIAAILSGFDQLAPGYSGFVRFLFGTGVRTSEAIGLTWEQVDLDRGTVTIDRSLSRDILANGYKRISKETKTGTVRTLTLSSGLRAILEAQRKPGVSPKDLVFTTPTGKPIDDGNFRLRQWKPILGATGVPYRHPYVTRHSFASHAIDQGIPITSVAHLLGHRDSRMVIETYAHMVSQPQLPQMF
jgi:integrase